jgi:hypothetical protein
VIGGVVLATPASAQTTSPSMQAAPPPAQAPAPGAPPLNPICTRLEAQLAMIERGGTGDPARDDQIRRYQDAESKQQAELDRVTLQAKRMGCDSSGFFSLFSGNSSQCGPINNQIQQMRANLDQIAGSLERLRGGFGNDSDSQRRSVLTALGQNSCGPQYAQYARRPSGPGNFLSNLFGNHNSGSNYPQGEPPDAAGADMGPQSGTYRTVCVRTCDGGYFPISFATVPARFPDDEKTCKALCPGADATLFAYRNPGEDINQAVSITGQPYTSLPNAFRFRTQYSPTCSCKPAGETWAQALKSVDDRAAAAQQGDIIVTEESAKKMQQRALSKPAPARKDATAATSSASAPASPAAASADTASGKIRTVGPTFIPATH